MANPTAPLEGGSAKVHFLTAHGNSPEFWVAVEDGTNAGSTSVGWAGVATHVEGDTLTAPGGTTTTAAPVVLVAGDDGSNVVPLQMSGSDLKVLLGTGSAAIGKLAANSGIDIGDVDVLSLPALAAGTNAIGKLAANDGVDIGDVTVNNAAGSGAYVQPGTSTLWDVKDRAARDLGKVDIAAFDVALPAGTNAIGKLAANSGVDIGDVDVLSLPTLASVTLVDTLTTITNDVSIDDGGNSITIDGDVGDNGPGFTPLYKYSNKTDTNEDELWDPTLNYLYITDIIISSIAANNVWFGFGAAGIEETLLKATLDVKGGLTHHFRSPIKSTDSGDNLYVDCSAADEVNITICGYESNS